MASNEIRLPKAELNENGKKNKKTKLNEGSCGMHKYI